MLFSMKRFVTCKLSKLTQIFSWTIRKPWSSKCCTVWFSWSIFYQYLTKSLVISVILLLICCKAHINHDFQISWKNTGTLSWNIVSKWDPGIILTQYFTFLNFNMGTVQIQSLIYDLSGKIVLTWLNGKSSNEPIFGRDYSHLV